MAGDDHLWGLIRSQAAHGSKPVFEGDVGRAVELKVRRATAEMADGTQVDDDPKSAAGKRPMAFPSPSAPMSRST